MHVGDVEQLAVGRDADVLRHAALRQGQIAEHLAIDQVDLHHALLELAGEDRELAVDREVGVVDAGALRRRDRGLHLVGLRIAQIEALQRLGDDDRRFAVGAEIHVVGIIDRDRLAGLAGLRIDRRQAAVGAALGVVGDPQGLEIPRRHDVLRIDPDLELVDHLQGRGIDHVDVVGLAVGHVDARQRITDRARQLARADLAVEVGRVGHRRHAGHRLDGLRVHRDRHEAGRGEKRERESRTTHPLRHGHLRKLGCQRRRSACARRSSSARGDPEGPRGAQPNGSMAPQPSAALGNAAPGDARHFR